MKLRTLSLLLALAGCAAPPSPTGSETADERTACNGGPVVYGVDVSYFQGNIDWTALKKAGYDFAFIRVSDGTGFSDPKFRPNWAGAHAANVRRGAYQFFRPGQSATAQANLLLQELAAVGPSDLPPVLDVEVTDGYAASTVVAGVRAWVARVTAAIGRRPVVYSSPGFWDGLGSPQVAADLWVAHWGVLCPTVPKPFSRFRLWQFNDAGHVPGIAGNVDLDLFDGTLAELDSWAAGKACPYGDGLYCGGDAVAGDTGTLYRCNGGALTKVRVCDAGCDKRPPGEDDRCKAADGGTTDERIASDCPYGDGQYCGGDGVRGNPQTLYRCGGGFLTPIKTCDYACTYAPAGQDDHCAAQPDSCPSGNGLYCGGNGIFGDINTLYRCSGGALTVERTCAQGCAPQPAGTDDHCR